jgi:hypothetical protein
MLDPVWRAIEDAAVGRNLQGLCALLRCKVVARDWAAKLRVVPAVRVLLRDDRAAAGTMRIMARSPVLRQVGLAELCPETREELLVVACQKGDLTSARELTADEAAWYDGEFKPPPCQLAFAAACEHNRPAAATWVAESFDVAFLRPGAVPVLCKLAAHNVMGVSIARLARHVRVPPDQLLRALGDQGSFSAASAVIRYHRNDHILTRDDHIRLFRRVCAQGTVDDAARVAVIISASRSDALDVMQEAMQRPTNGMVAWLITNFGLRRSELHPLLAGQHRRTSQPFTYVHNLAKQPFYAGAAVATVAILVGGWKLSSGNTNDTALIVACVVYLSIGIWMLTLSATQTALTESGASGYITVESISDEEAVGLRD